MKKILSICMSVLLLLSCAAAAFPAVAAPRPGTWSFDAEAKVLTVGPTFDFNAIADYDIPYDEEHFRLPLIDHCTVVVDEANPYYKSVDGAMYSKDGKTLYSLPIAKFTDENGTLTIPAEVERIEDNACSVDQMDFTYWAEMQQVKKIVLPEGLTYVGDHAFSGYLACEDLRFPDSLKMVGPWSFYRLESLKELDLNRIENVGTGAFSYGGMETVRGDHVVAYGGEGNYTLGTILASAVFRGCDSLKTIYIPATARRVCGYEPVDGKLVYNVNQERDELLFHCISLEKIIVDPANPWYSSDEDGVLYNKDKTMLLHYPLGKEIETYKVADTVKSIDPYAFAFMQKSDRVILPQNLETLGIGAFAWCWTLKEVVIQSGLKTIGVGAFYNDYELTKVTIPNTVTYIGENAFTTEKLSDVYFGGSKAQWNAITVDSGNDALKKATIHFADGTEDNESLNFFQKIVQFFKNLFVQLKNLFRR